MPKYAPVFVSSSHLHLKCLLHRISCPLSSMGKIVIFLCKKNLRNARRNEPWKCKYDFVCPQNIQAHECRTVSSGLPQQMPLDWLHGQDEYLDSKAQVTNMGPIWGCQDPGGPHIGHMNLVIRVAAFYPFEAVSIWIVFLSSYINNRTVFVLRVSS